MKKEVSLLFYLSVINNLIDQSILQCLLCCHKVITLCITADRIIILASVGSQNLIQFLPGTENIFRCDLNLGSLPSGASRRLMDHDFCIRKSDTFAFFSSGKKECAHTCSQTHANGTEPPGLLM